ncbi:MAG: RNA-binding transcriptional accessory protein [Legionellales bacterium]|nr:RNA-binding transcriptional accessory protein [Legionellales bacterium]
MNIVETIAKELNIKSSQVTATMELLNDGATVPFIARYRKEATGGLSDTVLRDLTERLTYLTELEDRRHTILKSIEEQGKLSPELKQEIENADSKIRLEDLYLPYKPKRRTKAQIAKEAGLEPLAQQLLTELACDAETCAKSYINPEKEIADAAAALEGARHILAELFCEQADLLQQLRDKLWQEGIIISKVAKDKEESGIKFADYFDFSESIKTIPSHRLLAIFRGRKENFLHVNLEFRDETVNEHCYGLIAKTFSPELKPSPTHWLWQTIVWAWKIKLKSKLDLEIMLELKNRADEEAIKVFRDNLKNLLMAAPAGNYVVLGLDPGYRTGVKTVIIDSTGKLLTHTVIYPHPPQKQWDEALTMLGKLCQHFKVKLISIGNGTASRETDQLANELIKQLPELGMTKIVVSEAGASVYSASELAAKEFPELDVSYRGAVSIARRLQDPLAELVKIDPKAIGVGQYQHDVNQTKLEHSLQATVEDCVNAVGADINTASVPLLTSISGLNETIAKNIVLYREQHGRFDDREQIKSVPRLGAKTFEQAAGFLRIINGKNPLDGSAVHPESYAIVEKIAAVVKKPVSELISNESLLNSLDPQQFVSDQVGLPTLRDIFDELKKPGRDPRPEFKMAKFIEGVNEIKDLKIGMELEGVITNVANFGAFVDIGVHQDGLVHVSEIADHFVKDLHQEVKVGQIVKVRVLEVDEARKRISLTMKQGHKPPKSAKPLKSPVINSPKPELMNAFAAQLKDAWQRK